MYLQVWFLLLSGLVAISFSAHSDKENHIFRTMSNSKNVAHHHKLPTVAYHALLILKPLKSDMDMEKDTPSKIIQSFFKYLSSHRNKHGETFLRRHSDNIIKWKRVTPDSDLSHENGSLEKFMFKVKGHPEAKVFKPTQKHWSEIMFSTKENEHKKGQPTKHQEHSNAFKYKHPFVHAIPLDFNTEAAVKHRKVSSNKNDHVEMSTPIREMPHKMTIMNKENQGYKKPTRTATHKMSNIEREFDKGFKLEGAPKVLKFSPRRREQKETLSNFKKIPQVDEYLANQIDQIIREADRLSPDSKEEKKIDVSSGVRPSKTIKFVKHPNRNGAFDEFEKEMATIQAYLPSKIRFVPHIERYFTETNNIKKIIPFHRTKSSRLSDPTVSVPNVAESIKDLNIDAIINNLASGIGTQKQTLLNKAQNFLIDYFYNNILTKGKPSSHHMFENDATVDKTRKDFMPHNKERKHPVYIRRMQKKFENIRKPVRVFKINVPPYRNFPMVQDYSPKSVDNHARIGFDSDQAIMAKYQPYFHSSFPSFRFISDDVNAKNDYIGSKSIPYLLY